MKSKPIVSIIQNGLETIYGMYPSLRNIVNTIASRGGTAYLVGGVVRDMFINKPIKDVDIEVHGLQSDQLQQLLQQFGVVDVVGKAFGVFKVHPMDIDWSLPRADSVGRKPTVAIDPHMPLKDAFARRDLTMNALGINMHTGELIDPFGGQQDIEQKRLRAPQIDFFVQDPLRFFRVMQFIARFAMYPDDELEKLCKKMTIATVSKERIEQEFHKMLLRSERPSLGIRWLRSIGRLKEVLPELAATIGVEQDAQWHPEGDVFEHSMQALDAAAQLTYANEYQKLIGLYAAMCHDLGKVTTSTKDQNGRIHSYGHAQVGARIAKKMLKRITANKKLIDQVSTLVRVHMIPLQLVAQKSKLSAYKRLARNLGPEVSMAQLAQLALADRRGRNAQSSLPLSGPEPEVAAFLAQAQQANVVHVMEPPLLTGKDFLDIIEPGPALGRLVKAAYELQLDGVADKAELKKRTLASIRSKGS